jgi:pimeloyl-ACP methyl ester carboxylesterase
MLHYTIQGNGPFIALIHGFCENSTCFSEQVFLLKQDYTVINIDLPGHGKSAEPAENTRVEDIAENVFSILETCGAEKSLIIGHSMGGYVALAFAKKYSHKLAGFGLLHSTANADNEEKKNKRDQAIQLIQQHGAGIYLRSFIPPLFSEGFSSVIIRQRVESNASISAVTLERCLQALKNRNDSHAFLQQTALPVLFLIGKYDTLIPESDLFLQASKSSVAKIGYLQQSAHMGMLEQPIDVANHIAAFAEYCFTIQPHHT